MAVTITTQFYETSTPAWHTLSKIVFTSPNLTSPSNAGTRSHILPGQADLGLWYEDTSKMYRVMSNQASTPASGTQVSYMDILDLYSGSTFNFNTDRSVMITLTSASGVAINATNKVYYNASNYGIVSSVTNAVNVTSTPATSTGSVSILYPTATGVSIGNGATHRIWWNSSAFYNDDLVNVLVSLDSGSNWITLATGIVNVGHADVLFPYDVGASSQTLLKLTSDYPSIYDVSDNVFTLTSGSLSLLYPTASGVNVLTGEPFYVWWNSSNIYDNSKVTISLSTDGGSNYTPLYTQLTNSGTNHWSLDMSTTSGSNAKIKVSKNDGAEGVESVSSNVFTIESPYINILPSSGTATTYRYYNNECTFTKWYNTSISSDKNLVSYYSTDGGTNWSVLATGTNSGHSSFTLPYVADDTNKVRLLYTNPTNTTITGTSETIHLIPGIENVSNSFEIFPVTSWADFCFYKGDLYGINDAESTVYKIDNGIFTPFVEFNAPGASSLSKPFITIKNDNVYLMDSTNYAVYEYLTASGVWRTLSMAPGNLGLKSFSSTNKLYCCTNSGVPYSLNLDTYGGWTPESFNASLVGYESSMGKIGMTLVSGTDPNVPAILSGLYCYSDGLGVGVSGSRFLNLMSLEENGHYTNYDIEQLMYDISSVATGTNSGIMYIYCGVGYHRTTGTTAPAHVLTWDYMCQSIKAYCSYTISGSSLNCGSWTTANSHIDGTTSLINAGSNYPIYDFFSNINVISKENGSFIFSTTYPLQDINRQYLSIGGHGDYKGYEHLYDSEYRDYFCKTITTNNSTGYSFMIENDIYIDCSDLSNVPYMIYDSVSGSWSYPIGTFFSYERSNPNGYYNKPYSVMCSDGIDTVYKMAEPIIGRFYKYSISTDTATELTSSPVVLADSAIMCYNDGNSCVYLIHESVAMNMIWVYNTITNTWSGTSNPPYVMSVLGMCSDGTDIYIITNSYVMKYDTNTDTWGGAHNIHCSGSVITACYGDDYIYILTSANIVYRFNVSTFVCEIVINYLGTTATSIRSLLYENDYMYMIGQDSSITKVNVSICDFEHLYQPVEWIGTPVLRTMQTSSPSAWTAPASIRYLTTASGLGWSAPITRPIVTTTGTPYAKNINFSSVTGSGVLSDSDHLYVWGVTTSSGSAWLDVYSSVVFKVTSGECYNCRLTAWDDVTHSTTLNQLLSTDRCRVHAVAFSSTKDFSDVYTGAIYTSVLDKDILTPPSPVVVGNRYLIGGTGAGGWASHNYQIAEGIADSSWSYTTMATGERVYVSDEGYYYNRTTGGITKGSKQFELYEYVYKPVHDQILKGNVYYYGDFNMKYRYLTDSYGDYLMFKPYLYNVDGTITYGVHDFWITLHYSYT